MNRRRVLNTVHRTLARKGINAVAWFSGQSFHQSAADMPFDRLSIADLDKAGPRLVTAQPAEQRHCFYCGGELHTDEYFPYCSTQCGINAENS